MTAGNLTIIIYIYVYRIALHCIYVHVQTLRCGGIYRTEIEGTCVLAQKKPSPYTRAKTTKYNKSRDYCLSPLPYRTHTHTSPPSPPSHPPPSHCSDQSYHRQRFFPGAHDGIHYVYTHIYRTHTHTRAFGVRRIRVVLHCIFLSLYIYIYTIVLYTLLLLIIYMHVGWYGNFRVAFLCASRYFLHIHIASVVAVYVYAYNDVHVRLRIRV